MGDASDNPLGFELMRRHLADQAERSRNRNELVIAELEKGVFPTPEPVARYLVYAGPLDQPELMRHHGYWKEHKIRLGLDALISAALAAHVDLMRCDAALTAYALSRESFDDHIDATVGNPAQKEVMAFCAAYFGTVDTLRRLRSVRPELKDAIDEVRKAATSEPEFRFVLELRRNLSHGSVVVPGWTIRSDFETASGAMKFSSAELLAFGTWTSPVKEFLESRPGGIFSIAEVVTVCARGLAKMRRDLEMLFARNRTPAEIDYFDLQDLYRRHGSRQLLKVFLNAFKDKGIDPYPHLHRFFPPDVVREILRRPAHSVEQVEYIITLRSAETDCDPALRAILYKLFGVDEEVEIPAQAPSLTPPPLEDWPPSRT